MTFTEIMRNQHFNSFASLIGAAYRLQWRQEHNAVPFWTLQENCTKLLDITYFIQQSGRKEFIMRFTALITALVIADTDDDGNALLSYTKEDMDWLVSVLDADPSKALAIMSMLFAVASSTPSLFTPAEVAEATNTGESTWRRKAVDGLLNGAHKAGKQWLIPITALRAHGVDMKE